MLIVVLLLFRLTAELDVAGGSGPTVVADDLCACGDEQACGAVADAGPVNERLVEDVDEVGF
jgi:hypothetical protein